MSSSTSTSAHDHNGTWRPRPAPAPANGSTITAAATSQPRPTPLTTTLSYSPSSSNSSNASPPPSPITSRNILHEAALLPGQAKSLSGISLRSFLLGIVFSTSISLCLLLTIPPPNSTSQIFTLTPPAQPRSSPESSSATLRIWRAPLFLSLLSTFHFLEFYTTAKYNTASASISAFLLSRNGRAYNIAHGAAFVECLVTSLFFPEWQARCSCRVTLGVGAVMVGVGQATRSVAMAQAGRNFNHTVQTRRAAGHTLVTFGVYSVLRHPSYFGFFWWAVGTQVLMGNAVCFCGYVVVLWLFFGKRIAREEELLGEFFGEEYWEYKKRTVVGIPFIR